MDATQIASLVTAGGGVLVAALAYFKYRPGQREATEVSVAASTLNIAQGTIDLVTGELEEQFKRMSAEARELRAQYAKDVEVERANAAALRRELAEVSADVRKLRRALKQTGDDLEACRKRCLHLENQLKELNP